jgi:amino acid transporter
MNSTTSDVPFAPGSADAAAVPQLRHDSLSLVEVLGQSVANIAPTLTPALNIAVVAGLAGVGSWISYLIATVAMVFVAASIGFLARRHPLAGSYFVYIGRNFGPFAGLIAGWSMIAAYLITAVAVVLGFTIFVNNVLSAFGLAGSAPPNWAIAVLLTALVWFAAYRDIRLSSRVGLVLEAISISIIVMITAIMVARHGTALDSIQFDSSKIPVGGVMSAMAFAVFSFVGFESAATLAKETRDASRKIPVAVTLSAVIVGVFFVVMAYFMMLAVADDAKVIGDSSSPLTELTSRAGLAWAAGVVYFSALISGFACALASINAAARMIFSMGRYRFLTRSMGAVHQQHRTPHLAVTLSCAVTLAISLALLPLGALDAFGYAGTFATFGFLVVYLLICIVAPIDLRRAGALRPQHVVTGAIGTVLMLFVIGGSLYPVPPWPMSLIPYLFAAYLLVGAGYFALLRRRDPAALATIEHDMEM